MLVTGTDTGVGKTVVAAWCAATLARSQRVALIKAAQTGTTEPARDGDEAFYRTTLHETTVTLETLVSLPEPLAPSIAAGRAGRPIDVAALIERCRAVAALHEVTLIEGAGGLLVSLNEEVDHGDYAGLAQELGASLMLVIRPALGTLNHTLLSVEAAERRRLEIECLVCSGYPARAGVVERENLRFLRRRYPALPIVVLQHADLGGADALARLRPRLLGDPPPLLAAALIERFDTLELED